MTPPYRRGYAYSPRAALRALMHSTVILSQLPATTSALGQTQGRSVLNLVQNDNGDDDGVGESFHYSHLKFLLKYVTEGAWCINPRTHTPRSLMHNDKRFLQTCQQGNGERSGYFIKKSEITNY